MGMVSKISKALHVTADLVLVSTVLAGIKRNTGLTPKTDFDSAELRGFVHKYLNCGEAVYDTSVGYMSASSYFVRR